MLVDFFSQFQLFLNLLRSMKENYISQCKQILSFNKSIRKLVINLDKLNSLLFLPPILNLLLLEYLLILKSSSVLKIKLC